MFKLKKLSIRNFLGFGNRTEEIDFSYLGTTLVLGENVDRGGANGCGKSTIANAISYALYNVPLETISKEKLVNTTNNLRNTIMEVALEFEVDGVQYKIKRGRGSDYDTRLYINDEDKTPDSIANINKKIVDIVGISFEMFRRTVYFKGSDSPFFEMRVGEQRDLIEELFKITKLSEKAENLKKLNQNLEKDIDVQTAQITAQEKARDLRAKHITEAELRTIKWEEDRVINIKKLRDQIEAVSHIDFAREEDLLNQVDVVTHEITVMQKSYDDTLRKYKLHNTAAQKATGELTHLKDQKCPYCLQKFEDGQKKIDELETALVEDTKLAEKNLDETANSKGGLEMLQSLKNQLLAQCKYRSLPALMLEKQGASTHQIKIDQLEAATNPHIEVYDSLLNEEDVVVDYSKLDAMKSDLEHQKFLLKLLIDKNSFIRKKIINKSVPFLNKQIHIHAKNLGLAHLVCFNPDMSCTISEYGRELDYGNLSGGEKKRLNLALSLAFRDMLHHLHSSVNILFVDEVDAGAMDVPGVEAIIRVIKDKAKEEKDMGIWIVSHRPECVGRFDREMIVKFENGFSSIDRIEEL
jgi:energy-coupling factor transporter ATP-binding protein EcfA2